MREIKPTKTEKLLLDGLRAFELPRGVRLRIFLMLDNEEQMWQMIDYMVQHQSAQSNELLAVAERIAKTAS